MIDLAKHPYIPLSNPEKQMEPVLNFCEAWGDPLILDYNSRKMILMPFAYYLNHFCTADEVEEIQKQLDVYRRESLYLRSSGRF